jgi:hypothetical protein
VTNSVVAHLGRRTRPLPEPVVLTQSTSSSSNTQARPGGDRAPASHEARVDLARQQHLDWMVRRPTSMHPTWGTCA